RYFAMYTKLWMLATFFHFLPVACDIAPQETTTAHHVPPCLPPTGTGCVCHAPVARCFWPVHAAILRSLVVVTSPSPIIRVEAWCAACAPLSICHREAGEPTAPQYIRSGIETSDSWCRFFFARG